MKTLIINGSPRKNGDTKFLIDEFCKNITGEVAIIDTYYCNVSPCNDCRYCYNNNACAIKDDMSEIFNKINEADNIIIASPIYFSELTGSMLNFFSRLQYLYVSKYFRNEKVLEDKKRNGFVFLVGGGDGASDKALNTAKCLLKQMESTFIDVIISHNTNNIKACEDDNIIKKINNINSFLGQNEISKHIGIIIFGANGSGKSTIGRELSKILNIKQMDIEDYCFYKSVIPYTNPRTKDDVVALMLADIKKYNSFIISTVKGDLGIEISSKYTIAIKINTPTDIRMKRINSRQLEKFGNRVLIGGDMYDNQQNFLNFALNRDLSIIDEWVKTLNCPVYTVDGTKPIDTLVQEIISLIKNTHNIVI